MSLKEKIKIIIMGSLIICILLLTSFILNRQINIPDGIRVKNFYLQKKNSLDVVLVGASTVYTDFSSPVAWNEFGYTSYSLGTPSAPMGLAKSMVKETIRTQNPKLIVIDINGILYNDKEETRDSFMRVWLDNMPYNKNRIEAINELVPKNDRSSYFIPLMKYHSNIAHIGDCLKDVKREIKGKLNPEYLSVTGMAARAEIKPMKNIVDIKNYNEESPMYGKSGSRLKELLDYCKKNNLKNIAFSNMPRFYTKNMLNQRRRLNTAIKLIKSYGYKVYDLDLRTKEIGLDKDRDFYNPNHLNIYGQIKTTKYLSQCFIKDFDIKSKHSKDTIDFWNREYKAFIKVYNWADDKMNMHSKNGKYNYKNIDKIINY